MFMAENVSTEESLRAHIVLDVRPNGAPRTKRRRRTGPGPLTVTLEDMLVFTVGLGVY
jgi:hypothetical protein